MPPPPIPERKEAVNPPPIPEKKEAVNPPPIPEPKEAVNPPPIPAPTEAANPPPIPVRSGPRPPPGAVATAMLSGGEGLPFAGKTQHEQQEEEVQARPNNPYELMVQPGATVTASYPFRGEESLQQLSFAVGDEIRVKQKEDMWSWGVLVRGGNEGWFPHNYVGTTFKPLPGIHEMAAKLKARNEKAAAAKAREDEPNPQSENADPTASSLDATADHTADATPDATASSQDATSDVKSAPGGDIVADGATSNETHPIPNEHLPDTSTGTGTGTAAVSEDVVPGPVDGVAREDEEVGGGVGNDVELKTTPKTENADKPALVSATPSLPPFLKGPTNTTGAATAVLPTSGAVREADSAEVVDTTQVHGVGFAGESPATRTGCKCTVM
ncbi:expressed unknown protein [Ectocarpus siliculosus]|uniref:SH3 domain-containing protein n=1 Tax=Ectocarpus siliculosus TaxID=2880 RepID=D7G4U8_ECTSI|nr:expressed unknown protein [Ectocarpus siliculosus]|eukprot:CBJ27191.1 expressed unknown protein [Ectocarpus siliculosus]